MSKFITALRTRTAQRIAFFTVLPTLLVGGSAAASYASTVPYTDPTNGAGSTFISSLKGFFLNSVVGEALGLMVVVLAISVLVSWGRKAIKSR